MTETPPVKATPPAPTALTFHTVFALPFGATVTGMRLDSVEGTCRVGLEYRRESPIHAHPSFEFWSYAEGAQGAVCDPVTGDSTNLPAMFHAVKQLAGLGPSTIAIDVSVRSSPEHTRRFLAAVASLPPDTEAAIVAKRAFDQGVFGGWQRFVDTLGFRVTGVELFMLEPEDNVSGVSAAELKAMAAPGPYPPRLPRRVSLLVERAAPLVVAGNPAAKPRTFRSLYALPFDVSINSLALRADQAGCAATLSLGGGGLRLSAEPETCELTATQLERELPDMWRAGSELTANAPPKLAISTSFRERRVLEKWIPIAKKSPRETDYKKLGALMKENGVFAHLDPFVTAIGYTVSNVGMEKLSWESGAALLARDPALASTGLVAKDKIPAPLMSWLVLERP